MEQLKDANMSAYDYKVIFKPVVIVPDIELKKLIYTNRFPSIQRKIITSMLEQLNIKDSIFD